MSIRENIIESDYSDIMKQNYIDYAMSVIMARALPDVRDGLKPVQRRILFDCKELGISSDKEYRKSARIVGDTMGRYHPHGDSSIYDALVVMAQDFKKGERLIDGHGNFGSIEGDRSAAMRYTESRLTPFSEGILLDSLNHDTIDFIPNYDGTEKEPEVLPAKLPNFLINGTEGIAVGMASYVPPHNTKEVIDALSAYIKNPNISTEELLKYMPGPDFPTGGIIVNKNDMLDLYETGNGKVNIRGKVEIEKRRNGAESIVITEIPYTMVGSGIAKFLTAVEDLATSTVSDISDISNQSSKDGMRIVIDLKKGASAEKILPILYKKTKLEDSLSVNMLAIKDQKPEVMGLKNILSSFLDFRMQTVTREYTYLLKEEESALEVEEGLWEAADIIDLIIEVIRGSKTKQNAMQCLTKGNVDKINFKTKRSMNAAKKLHFTERQAVAIMDMRLSRLIGLEVNALEKSILKHKKLIEKYRAILGSEDALKKDIISNLALLKKQYGTDRKTEIKEEKIKNIIIPEAEDVPFVVLVNKNGYVRTMTEGAFKRSNGDEYVCHTHKNGTVVFMTQFGVLHTIKGDDLYRIKNATPLDAISEFNSDKDEILLIAGDEELKDSTYVLCTKNGFAKRIKGEEFITKRKCIVGTKVNEDDVLLLIQKEEPVIELHSSDGYILSYDTSEIALQKRASYGVSAINLTKGNTIEEVLLRSLKEGEKLSHRGRRGTRPKPELIEDV